MGYHGGAGSIALRRRVSEADRLGTPTAKGSGAPIFMFEGGNADEKGCDRYGQQE